jgi:hypothetical protein
MVHVQLTYSDSNGAYSDPFTLPQGSAQGQYTVFVSASKVGFNNGQAQTRFSVGTQTISSVSTSSASISSTSFSSQTTAKSTPSPPNKCLIATATFGSELTPEVAQLRNFRDTEVLQTAAGSSFMQAFNAFYYSFSPQVASFIAPRENVRAGMRIVLYPLIGILYLANRLFKTLSFNMELAVTLSGTFAAFSIGAVYLGPILLIAACITKKANTSRRYRAARLILTSCLVSVTGILFAEVANHNWLLLATTVSAVLGFVVLGGYAVLSFARSIGAKAGP